MTTSTILVTTSKKYGYSRHGGAVMLKGPVENTVLLGSLFCSQVLYSNISTPEITRHMV